MTRARGLLGFLLGLALGLAVSSAATSVRAPDVEQNVEIDLRPGSGYLRGWTVRTDEYWICEDPWVSTSTHQVWCE